MSLAHQLKASDNCKLQVRLCLFTPRHSTRALIELHVESKFAAEKLKDSSTLTTRLMDADKCMKRPIFKLVVFTSR